MNFFLTGTDTDVGKTYVACLLIRALRRAGLDTIGLKPICCGDRSDAKLLHSAAGGEIDIEDVNPVWLKIPASPYAATICEQRDVEMEKIIATFRRLRGRYRSIIIEGVGGWLVPIRKDYFVADLAAEFGLPVVVVVRDRIGALNHLLLTLEAIRSRGLACGGIILNQMDGPLDLPATATNKAVIEEINGGPILLEVSHGQREIELAIG
jgi:dethiobiotin synthetase